MTGNLTVSEKVSNLWNKQVELNQNVKALTESNSELKKSNENLKQEMVEDRKRFRQLAMLFKILSILVASGLLIAMVYIASLIKALPL